jgi:hypothetical protein
LSRSAETVRSIAAVESAEAIAMKGRLMKTDLLLLTLMYVVAFAAFIGAINARGPARVALSYFLAILCLCAAVFHTSQYLAAPSLALQAEQEAVVMTPPVPKLPDPPQAVAVPAPDTQGLAASKQDANLGEAKNDLKGVLESGLRVSRNLSSLNLGSAADISDEEYEGLQNRAIGYLSEARRVKEKLGGLSGKIPPGLNDAQDALSKGAENLAAAAANAERFFKSENDQEEKERLAAFRRGSQAASSSFRKAGELLGSPGGD